MNNQKYKMTKICTETELRELAIMHDIIPSKRPNVGPYGDANVYQFMRAQCPNIPNDWLFVEIHMRSDGGVMFTHDHTDQDFDQVKQWIQTELHTGND
jgi:hypothetical protein